MSETMTARDMEALKKFARSIIGSYCWSQEPDGGDIQDQAAALGLITRVEVTADTAFELQHIEDIFEMDYVYVFTDWLKVSDAPEQEGQ